MIKIFLHARAPPHMHFYGRKVRRYEPCNLRVECNMRCSFWKVCKILLVVQFNMSCLMVSLYVAVEGRIGAVLRNIHCAVTSTVQMEKLFVKICVSWVTKNIGLSTAQAGPVFVQVGKLTTFRNEKQGSVPCLIYSRMVEADQYICHT